eukprot:5782371-Alexandrium_andersonii.AAC.1
MCIRDSLSRRPAKASSSLRGEPMENKGKEGSSDASWLVASHHEAHALHTCEARRVQPSGAR